MEKFKLNDGNFIPAVGFGVFLIPNDGSTYTAVSEALKAGYRHIDTAAAYFNEEEVGRAVKDSGIPRGEIFITSKLWLQDYGYDAAKKGLETSLKKLGSEYIDLYLLHQPYGDVAGAWKALEDAKKEGKLRLAGLKLRGGIVLIEPEVKVIHDDISFNMRLLSSYNPIICDLHYRVKERQ